MLCNRLKGSLGYKCHVCYASLRQRVANNGRKNETLKEKPLIY